MAGGSNPGGRSPPLSDGLVTNAHQHMQLSCISVRSSQMDAFDTKPCPKPLGQPCPKCAPRVFRCTCTLCLVFAAAGMIRAAEAAPLVEPLPPDTVPPVLTEQVTPTYPDVESADLHGDVFVEVDIDATGAVTAARPVSGAAVFHAAAVEAALTLQFRPAQRQGTAVPVTQRVRFHFEPPGQPVHSDSTAGEIVVEAVHPDRDTTKTQTTLGDAALERATGDDLASTVSQVPGVTVAGGSTDQAKPIIRGQSERRLLLIDDGVRHESQKWGPDHAPEIDPFRAGAIRVIRGAAGARYGPDAIGGVVLVDPPPMRSRPGVGGKAMTQGATNGRRAYGAFRLDAVHPKATAWSTRIEGTVSSGSALQSPNYVLGNTATHQWSAGASVQWTPGRATLRVGYTHYDLYAGIFYGLQSESPSDFDGAVTRARPVTADLWTVDPTIDRPYQDVSHDRATLHADWETESGGSINLVYAYQHNDREEYEPIRGSNPAAQYDFLLRTHSADALWSHAEQDLGSGHLEGGVGGQGLFQENVYDGYSLIPNYRSFAGGAFLFERWHLPRGAVEAGGRIDHVRRAAYLDESDHTLHQSRGSLPGDTCSPGVVRYRCAANYTAGSISLGGLWKVVPDKAELKLDLSSASRVPNVDEAFQLGSAPTFPVWAVGQPDLGVETTWGGSLTAAGRADWFNTELSVFANYVDDYIYFSPARSASGNLDYEVSIRGTWPVYTFAPIQAAFYGTDGFAALGPESSIGLDVLGSVVRATDLADGRTLVGTPPDRAQASLVLRPRGPKRVQGLEFRGTVERVGRQSRVDPRDDFAPAPEGYTLLGASAKAEVPLRSATLRFGLAGHNLLDTAYREYTSLIRYYADQPGRDLRLRVGVDF